jgi:hypothetical protein
MAIRPPRKAVVVLVGGAGPADNGVLSLLETLAALDVETLNLGREDSAKRIAAAVSKVQADAVEVCVGAEARTAGLLLELLRELIAVGRRDVSIVVHRLR